MRYLGVLAAIATIVAAIYTVAGYYQGKPPNTEKLELVEKIPNRLPSPIAPDSIQSEQNYPIGPDDSTSPEELKELHEITNNISFLPTRNSELEKLAQIALQKNHIDYAITIARDIKYLPTRNDTLKSISLFSLKRGEKQLARKAAELINYTTTQNDVLNTILEHGRSQ